MTNRTPVYKNLHLNTTFISHDSNIKTISHVNHLNIRFSCNVCHINISSHTKLYLCVNYLIISPTLGIKSGVLMLNLPQDKTTNEQ